MKKLLVIIDMQNDFITGALGSNAALDILPIAIDKIKNWHGDIAYTKDTHYSDYLNTNEGKHLPVPHCIYNTFGWELRPEIKKAILDSNNNHGGIIHGEKKNYFGSLDLANWIAGMKYDYIEIMGLCTDICVISNALYIKAFNPQAEVKVVANCCAGSTIEAHKEALDIMQNCHIDII